MKIALIGPSELTELDKREIADNIEDFVSKGNDIVLLAYRSIEIEVFKYFVQNLDEKIGADAATRLHIHTFQPLQYLPEKIKAPIEYLREKGASYHSFNFNQTLIKRSTYIESWKEILTDVDIMVCFYDGEKSTLMIPIDEAKNMGKRAVVYKLPKYNQEHFLLEPNEKFRIVE